MHTLVSRVLRSRKFKAMTLVDEVILFSLLSGCKEENLYYLRSLENVDMVYKI